jgi:hypothetical protein
MIRLLGRVTFWGFVAFLFAKGALVLRQKETVAAVSTLLAALMHACSGPESVADPAPRVAVNIVSTAHATPAPASNSAHGICANPSSK